MSPITRTIAAAGGGAIAAIMLAALLSPTPEAWVLPAGVVGAAIGGWFPLLGGLAGMVSMGIFVVVVALRFNEAAPWPVAAWRWRAFCLFGGRAARDRRIPHLHPSKVWPPRPVYWYWGLLWEPSLRLDC